MWALIVGMAIISMAVFAGAQSECKHRERELIRQKRHDEAVRKYLEWRDKHEQAEH